MWRCPYCGEAKGQPFADSQLQGMLCLNPECGRFDSAEDSQEALYEWDSSDF
ncbi:hypothetical protein [Brevibacillus massiliensis]|jgi:hypothetical protein|uniref:hypothetical protein n=1 Tax=Brevibacillus massiliensis TaxID=1118054 RepID=UPI0002E6A293|nr:hypothetical protein [Brevibacillus massiliensis]